jgi:polyvinyl alcohol dehydrogenase (cytochrome)
LLLLANDTGIARWSYRFGIVGARTSMLSEHLGKRFAGVGWIRGAVSRRTKESWAMAFVCEPTRRLSGVLPLACIAMLTATIGCSDDGSSNRTSDVSAQPGVNLPAPGTSPGATAPPAAGAMSASGTQSGGNATGSAGTAPVATAGTAAPVPSGMSGGGVMSSEPPAATTSEWALMGYDLGSTYNNTAETVLTKENAANLEQAWTADMGGNVYGAPLQIGSVIYASGPSSVRAFDAASGQERWSTPVGSTASLAYAEGTLYLNTNAGQLVAIDAADGGQLWTKAHDSQTSDGSASPVVAGELVLIGGSNGGLELRGGTFRGYMSALDRMTGDLVWTTYTVPDNAKGASLWSSPSADLAAGRAYGSTGNNYGSPATDTSDAIIAFNLQTGAIEWKNQRTEGDTFGGFGGGPDYDFGANPVLYRTSSKKRSATIVCWVATVPRIERPSAI